MEVTRKLILTGCRVGITCVLRKLQFVNGEHTVLGSENDVDKLCLYMGRAYRAFPVGSADLAHYQALDKEAGRASNIDPDPQPVAQVQRGDRPARVGSAPQTADNGGAAAAAQANDADGDSSGDGHEHTGDEEQTLQQVILALDKDDDEKWTAQGQPRIDAVAAASGREDLTRRLVEEAAPDFTRPTA